MPANLPRVNISYDADIFWIRMEKRTTNPDNANAADRFNFAIVNDNLVWVDSLGNVHTVISGAVPWSAFYTNAAGAVTLTTYNGVVLGAAGATTTATGVMPSHVTAITKAEWWFVLLAATGNEQYDSDIQFGTIDEAYTTNTASVSNQPIVQTSNNDIYKVSVLSLFSGVTANDIWGCRLVFDRINSGTLVTLGLYLEGA